MRSWNERYALLALLIAAFLFMGFDCNDDPLPPKPTFELAIDSDPSGARIMITISGNTATKGTPYEARLRGGIQVTVAAPDTFEANKFLYWLLDGEQEDGSVVTVEMNLSHTLLAVYEGEKELNVQASIPNVPITLSPCAIGNMCGGNAPISCQYIYNTEVTVECPEVFGGKVFKQWLDNDVVKGGSTTYVARMDQARTLKAEYQDPAVLTITDNLSDANVSGITINPADIDGKTSAATPATFKCRPGSSYTVTAPATIPYHGVNPAFVRWCPNSVADRSISVLMSEAKSLQALYPQYVTFRPSDIAGCTNSPATCALPCLQHECGDADFDGDGPRINVKLELYSSGSQIYARFYMHAVESDSGFTECDIRMNRAIYAEPSGRSIYRILGTTTWTRNPLYVDNNVTEDVFSNPCSMLRELRIKGDTDGDDVTRDVSGCLNGNCGCDRTHAGLYWNNIEFLVVPRCE